jgi:hypothetical protein
MPNPTYLTSCSFLFVCLTQSCYIAQAGLKLTIFLLPPPKCWGYLQASTIKPSLTVRNFYHLPTYYQLGKFLHIFFLTVYGLKERLCMHPLFCITVATNSFCFLFIYLFWRYWALHLSHTPRPQQNSYMVKDNNI